MGVNIAMLAVFSVCACTTRDIWKT